MSARRRAPARDADLGARSATRGLRGGRLVAAVDDRFQRRDLHGLDDVGVDVLVEDVLGELVVSTRVLGTTEILLLNHTGCGFTTFTDEELNAKLSASTGDASPAPMRFFSFKDPEENTREQIKKVRSHPWIAKDVPVRGFIFDVETGLLEEVHALVHQAAD